MGMETEDPAVLLNLLKEYTGNDYPSGSYFVSGYTGCRPPEYDIYCDKHEWDDTVKFYSGGKWIFDCKNCPATKRVALKDYEYALYKNDTFGYTTSEQPWFSTIHDDPSDDVPPLYVHEQEEADKRLNAFVQIANDYMPEGKTIDTVGDAEFLKYLVQSGERESLEEAIDVLVLLQGKTNIQEIAAVLANENYPEGEIREYSAMYYIKQIGGDDAIESLTDVSGYDDYMESIFSLDWIGLLDSNPYINHK